MKKAFLFLILIALCFSLYAFADKVCIYPQNAQLSSYIKDYFSIETKSCNVSISEENLKSANEKIMQYICKASKSDFLIIPTVSDLGGFNLYQVRVYDLNSGEFELIYEHLTQDSQLPVDVVYAVQPYLSKNAVEIKEMEDNSEIAYMEFSDLPVNSDISADVYVNGQYAGTTPFVLSAYQVPSLIMFKSEGYEDLVIKLDSQLDKLEVSLKADKDDVKEQYNLSRDNFYRSFSNLLLSFGVRAAVPAFANSALPLYKALDIGSYALLGVNAADSVKNLIKYYNNAKEVSP